MFETCSLDTGTFKRREGIQVGYIGIYDRYGNRYQCFYGPPIITTIHSSGPWIPCLAILMLWMHVQSKGWELRFSTSSLRPCFALCFCNR